ncbi:MAG: RES family NAD+ phosphorylase, partial [Leifsonia sp.]
MTRARVAQKAPAHDVDLTEFPTARPKGVVVRAHSRGFGPWYFANVGAGRFDLREQRGTCYAADAVRTAVRERLGESSVTSKIVAFDDADAMRISLLQLPTDFRAAAISAPGADDFPVTGELSSMIEYTVTQAWAARFEENADVRFDGINYRSRFAISEAAECWAIFGPAGADPEHPVAHMHVMDGHSAC